MVTTQRSWRGSHERRWFRGLYVLLLASLIGFLSSPGVSMPPCTDADGDGVCVSDDCDDLNPFCALSCSDGDGDGYCDDQDNCPDDFNPDQARVTKLNGSLVTSGDVTQNDFLVSADSTMVIYRADQDTNEVFELYSVPVEGGAVIKLNDPLVAGGDVRLGDFLVSADSTTVVYLADQDTDDMFELYSVPVGGGRVKILNDPLVAGGDVIAFRISADSKTVVYRADQDADGVFELYSVRIGGGPAKILNDPLVSGGNVITFRISADSTTVVYRADQEADNSVDLYSVPIGGGTAIRINEPLLGSGGVVAFDLSSDSTTVVYRANKFSISPTELYSVPMVGGPVTKINGPLVAGGDLVEFRISADSTMVVYRADQDTEGVFELYSVPLGGGLVTKLNEPLVAGIGVLTDFLVSGDSTTVVYHADQDADGVRELYSVAVGGGTATRINGPLVTGGEISPGNFLMSSDSATVVYLADQDTDGVVELYSVPLGGGLVTKLNGPLVAGGDVHRGDFHVSADSTTVVYLADQDIDDIFELYSVPVGGGPATKLSGPMVESGDVLFSRFLVSADSAMVVYRADQETNEVNELYSVGLTTDAAGLDRDADGFGFVCDCDDSRQYCTTDCTDADGDNICLPADCDDTKPNCTTDCTLDADGDGFDCVADCDDANSNCATDCTDADGDGFCITNDCDDSKPFCAATCGDPDGDSYCDDQDNCPGEFNPGQVSVTKINGSLVRGGDVKSEAVVVRVDSTTAIYRADQESNNVIELYSVPVGGGTVTKLNGQLVSGGDVWDGFRTSADSTTVVYRADQDTDEVFELYSVPVGGGTVTKLNGQLVSGGDVTLAAYLVSADSSTVVYLASQDTSTVRELYSVPIGGGPATKLNANLVSGGNMQADDFLISADSITVVYRADQDTDEVFELYSVPIGGGAVTKISGPLPAAGDVFQGNFLISADSSTVVYRADQDTNNIFELYSVPIDGGVATRLTVPLGPLFDVTPGGFLISADSATVVYIADGDTDEVFELYSVPIGGGAATKINGPLVAGGDLVDFGISSDSTTVIYSAEQDVDLVIELYSVPMGGGAVIKLNGPLVAGGDVRLDDFRISADNTTVVYRADQDTDEVRELYSVPIGGGITTKLSGILSVNGDVQAGFLISDDSRFVVYLADQDTNDVVELYSVGLTTNPGGVDRDGDGSGLACDCDDENAMCAGDCTDVDGDSYCITSDCDDMNPNCTTDCTDADGDNFCVTTDCDDTTPNCTTDCSDADGDGLNCADDCDDANPNCGTDCTDADQDGYCITTDCDDEDFNCNANCGDADGDGLACADDCDDANPNCSTDCTDSDQDGYCITTDCDDSQFDCTFDCAIDLDGDGLNCVDDCDDSKFHCTTDCTDADGDSYCVTVDCSDSAANCTTDCTDSDGDGFICPDECNDTNAAVYPGAPEINDLFDNQCPGDPGYGLINEVEGPVQLTEGAGFTSVCWSAQPGGTNYQVRRCIEPGMVISCVVFNTTITCIDDMDDPMAGEIFFYRVRVTAPNLGTW